MVSPTLPKPRPLSGGRAFLLILILVAIQVAAVVILVIGAALSGTPFDELIGAGCAIAGWHLFRQLTPPAPVPAEPPPLPAPAVSTSAEGAIR